MAYLRAEGLETPLLEYRIMHAWEELMGPVIMRYTRQVYVRQGMLHVQLSSSALKQNLMMEHKQLTKRLNDHVGSLVISDVKFV